MPETPLQSHMDSPVDMALALASRGIPVFPIWEPDHSTGVLRCTCPKGKECQNAGKHPVIAKGHLSASTKPEVIKHWWSKWRTANIGVDLAGAGLGVIGPDNPEWLVKFEGYGLPETLTVQSGGGEGHRHYYYKMPDSWPKYRNCVSGQYDIINGGYTIGPGSYHKSGRQYTILHEAPIVDAPAWAEQWLQPKRKTDSSAPLDPTEPPVLLGKNGLEWWTGAQCVKDDDDRIDRSLSLRQIANTLAEAGATRRAIVTSLRERDAYLSEHVWHTEPKYIGRTDEGIRYKELADQALAMVVQVKDLQGKSVIRTIRKQFGYEDVGNALRLVDKYGKVIRYCSSLETWYIWDGRRWKTDTMNRIFEMAVDSIETWYDEVNKTLSGQALQEAGRWYTMSRNMYRIDAMIRAAAHRVDEIKVELDDLDAIPYYRNCLNGTIDTRTGELLPHNPDHLITKLIDVEYHQDAGFETGQRFLDDLFPEPAIQRYVKQLFGCIFSGERDVPLIPIFYGTGRNGKSTLIESIAGVLGEYSVRLSREFFLSSRVDSTSATPEIMSLKGVCLGYSNEGDADKPLAEAKLKDLTGGDMMVGRPLYGKPQQFKPMHSVLLATNHKPKITGTDEGIWRRVKLIEFDRAFVEDPDPADPREKKVDLKLKTKLMAENSGWLKWLVEGCLDWREHGFAEPRGVTQSTGTYRSESDELALFFEERCRLDPDAHVTRADLYRAYARWCGLERSKPIRKGVFMQSMRERRFKEKQIAAEGWCWLGIEVLPDLDDGVTMTF